MRSKAIHELTVFVASQSFSLFILSVGMVWADLSCNSILEICQIRSFCLLVGGLMAAVVFHMYLAFRVGTSENR